MTAAVVSTFCRRGAAVATTPVVNGPHIASDSTPIRQTIRGSRRIGSSTLTDRDGRYTSDNHRVSCADELYPHHSSAAVGALERTLQQSLACVPFFRRCLLSRRCSL